MVSIEAWRRNSSFSPQRRQKPGSPAPAGRDSSWQASQDTRPACAALRLRASRRASIRRRLAVDPFDPAPELARVDMNAIAGISSINAPTAYMPMPASTVASSAILTSATRMPSIMTSSIDHT